jgi:hypothetical protein
MGVDVLVITPDAAWPALPQLAERYGVPCAVADGAKSYQQFAAEVVELAHRRPRSGPEAGTGRVAAAPDGRSEGLLDRGKALAGALDAGRARGVAVLLGEPSAKQTFFSRTLQLMEACLAQRAVVLLGGELGAHADVLTGELRARRGETLAAFEEALRGDGLRPVSAFGSSLDLPRVVSVLARLQGNGGSRPPRAIVALPEFYRTATWASAVTFLALGFPVQLGVRVPFWGSPALTRVLTEEWPRITGAKLLAGPSVPEAPAQAEEIAAFFQA